MGADEKTILHHLCASDKEVPTLVFKAVVDAHPASLTAVDSSNKTPLDYAKSNSKLPQTAIEMLGFLSVSDIKVIEGYPELLNAIEEKKAALRKAPPIKPKVRIVLEDESKEEGSIHSRC